MGKKKSEAKVKCKNDSCGKVIFLTDGKPLAKKKRVDCPHCGHENQVVVKRNGKIKIS